MDANEMYLRIIMLILLTFSRSSGFASGFSFPLNVGLKSFQRMSICSPSFPTRKSYSQLMVLCSLPFGLCGNNSSLRMNVYFLSSADAMSSRMPVYGDRSHTLSSPIVRCDAKPAPPRVLMSRFPWKWAVGWSGVMVRWDWEDPPRTLSSEDVQSEGDHGLECVRRDFKFAEGQLTWSPQRGWCLIAEKPSI